MIHYNCKLSGDTGSLLVTCNIYPIYLLLDSTSVEVIQKFITKPSSLMVKVLPQKLFIIMT